MNVILDASALLAFLQDEPDSEQVRGLLSHSVMSSVNWSEVVQKALAKGADPSGLWEDMAALGVRIHPFTREHAEIAGKLWLSTRTHGLSLGDRSCLALGLQTGYPVITADKAWQALNLGLEIRIIRP